MQKNYEKIVKTNETIAKNYGLNCQKSRKNYGQNGQKNYEMAKKTTKKLPNIMAKILHPAKNRVLKKMRGQHLKSLQKMANELR